MKLHLIGVHYKTKSKESGVIGFRIYDSDEKIYKDVPYNAVVEVIKGGTATIEGLRLERGKLKGSNGSINRYPSISNRKLFKNNSIIVIKELGDIGYNICNWEGKEANLRNEDIIKVSEKMGIANGKVVHRDDGAVFISAINGNYDRVEVAESGPTIKNSDKNTGVKEKETEQPESSIEAPKQKESVQAKSTDEMERKKQELKEKLERARKALKNANGGIKRIIGGEPDEKTVDTLASDGSGLTVEQKFTRAILAIRDIRTFYYAILSNIDKIESREVATMGVTESKLYYNPDFVSKMKESEIVAVLIHEVLHLAMMHPTRRGSRRPDIWNAAADIYVNEVILDEFQIRPGEKKVLDEDTRGIGIEMLEDMLYDPDIDLDKDTPEYIYARMLKELEEREQDKQCDGGESNGKSDGSSGGSGSNSNNDNTSAGNGGGGSSDDGDEEDGASDGSGGISKGKHNDVDDEEDGQGGDEGKTSKQEELTYKGKKIKPAEPDLIEDKESSEKTASQKEAQARTILERSVLLKKQIDGYGKGMETFAERFVEEALAPKVRWESLLRNKLTKASQTVNTYAKPDKRFISRNMILPGPKRLENDTLENIKICIDTSGSISDKDLGIAMTQIAQLLKLFKAKAEVLYWDTEVRATAEFEDIETLIKQKPVGGGGTDANCIFEHFETGDYKKWKKAKPSIIIIFTDGYFGEVDSKYKKYKDTIWVIDKNNGFKKPFGLMAKFKVE